MVPLRLSRIPCGPVRIWATVIIVDAVVELDCLWALVETLGHAIAIPIDGLHQARVNLLGLLCISMFLDFDGRSTIRVGPKFGVRVATETCLRV